MWSSRQRRPRQRETFCRTRMVRTYGSGSPVIRPHAPTAFTSVCCSRSSASWWSPVSRYAVRSSASYRAATKASKSSRPAATGPPLDQERCLRGEQAAMIRPIAISPAVPGVRRWCGVRWRGRPSRSVASQVSEPLLPCPLPNSAHQRSSWSFRTGCPRGRSVTDDVVVPIRPGGPPRAATRPRGAASTHASGRNQSCRTGLLHGTAGMTSDPGIRSPACGPGPATANGPVSRAGAGRDGHDPGEPGVRHQQFGADGRTRKFVWGDACAAAYQQPRRRVASRVRALRRPPAVARASRLSEEGKALATRHHRRPCRVGGLPDTSVPA